jgi:cbb3-type cytochrome oxidase maturation protein
MSIIIILITISLSIAILFLLIFYWNMKSGQYDDTYTPSVRMLFDNNPVSKKELVKAAEPADTKPAQKIFDRAPCVTKERPTQAHETTKAKSDGSTPAGRMVFEDKQQLTYQ